MGIEVELLERLIRGEAREPHAAVEPALFGRCNLGTEQVCQEPGVARLLGLGLLERLRELLGDRRELEVGELLAQLVVDTVAHRVLLCLVGVGSVGVQAHVAHRLATLAICAYCSRSTITLPGCSPRRRAASASARWPGGRFGLRGHGLLVVNCSSTACSSARACGSSERRQRARDDAVRSGGPPAPPPGIGASRSLRQELVDEELERARLARALGALSDQSRSARGWSRRCSSSSPRWRELPEELDERVLDALLGGLLQGKRSEREILGRDGLLGELTCRLVERAPAEELSEHLGYPAGHAPPGGAGNSRNGGTPKTLLTDYVPRHIIGLLCPNRLCAVGDANLANTAMSVVGPALAAT